MTEVTIEFKKLIDDFVKDMRVTFPEYGAVLNKWHSTWSDIKIHAHCKAVYKSHYHAILYRTETLFQNFEINTEFLPGVSFAFLWQFEDLEDTHKGMIWNYLQMVMISVMTKEEVGDTNIQETISSLEETFAKQEKEMPNFMNSKLAEIAKEIAEESSDTFGDLKDVSNVSDVFQKFLKDPSKLMEMVKNVGEKLDKRLKTGDLNEGELLDEASQMMSKMKGMPGLNEMINSVKQQQQFKNPNSLNKKGKGKNNKGKAKNQNTEEDKFFDEVFKELY